MSDYRIKLVPLEKEYIERIRRWRLKSDIRKNFFSWQLVNKIQQEKWFENYCADKSSMIFSIIREEDHEFIGIMSLNNIDHFHQRAELGSLIGEKKYWGKGYATESLNLLLEYGFNELNLNKVYSYIYSDNKGSIKKNQKNGFEIDGTLREHAFGEGRYKDVVVMSILKKQYFGD